MLPQQIISACKAYPLHAPTPELIPHTHALWIKDPTLIGYVTFLFNMLDSRNISWVECVWRVAGG